jgi:RNA polymerase sigma-70 factor (ECF subfamily)
VTNDKHHETERHDARTDAVGAVGQVELADLYELLPDRLAETTAPYDVETALARFVRWATDQRVTAAQASADDADRLIDAEGETPHAHEHGAEPAGQMLDLDLADRALALWEREIATQAQAVELEQRRADLEVIQAEPQIRDAGDVPVRQTLTHAAPTKAEGFDDFFRREYKNLVASVMFLGAPREEAEIAVSEAMVLAVRQFSKLDRPAAWVRVVAQRLYIKRAQRERALQVREALTLMPPSARPNEPADQDLLRLVQEAMSMMPPAQARVLALTIDGYTAGEIASMLGHQASTVRSNLRDARARLAAALKRVG